MGLFSGLPVSLFLALAVVMAVMFIFTGDGWNWISFRYGMTLMPIIIGVWVVPISVVLGLVYAIIRRAIRLERRQSVPVEA